MDLDVAVVGGGVSGAYSAWRLQQEKGAKARIALFEYSDRIGGRLYTVTLPGLPHVKAEVGGMRYIPDSHIMVADLVKHLGLATKNFPMGAPKPVFSNCNLFYLRGRHLFGKRGAAARLAPHALHRANQRYTTQPMCHLQVRQTGLTRPSLTGWPACFQTDRPSAAANHTAQMRRGTRDLGSLN